MFNKPISCQQNHKRCDKNYKNCKLVAKQLRTLTTNQLQMTDSSKNKSILQVILITLNILWINLLMTSKYFYGFCHLSLHSLAYGKSFIFISRKSSATKWWKWQNENNFYIEKWSVMWFCARGGVKSWVVISRSCYVRRWANLIL